jgi:PAS domain S-box-containing protein
MKLSIRLTLTMVTLVVITVLTAGYVTYRNIIDIVVQRSLARMDLHARLLANEVRSVLHTTTNDIVSFRTAAAIDDVNEARWGARMAARFVGELKSKPDYLQFRVIGIDDGGRELVRVDRDGPNGAIRILREDQLQREGSAEYFKDAIKLPAGSVYVSAAALYREYGKIRVPHIPVVRVATPLYAGDNRLFGIVIIDLDMRKIFGRLAEMILPGARLFVVNEHGNFLVHPDSARAFEFELGDPKHVQDELPEIASALSGEAPGARLIRDRTGDNIGAAVATVQASGGFNIALIEIESRDQIMQLAVAIRQSSLNVGFAALLSALGLALLLSRSITVPLMQMTRAVQAFGRGEPMVVPTGGPGAIGILAHAFESMATEVRDKTIALVREIDERRRAEAEIESYAVRERLYIAAVNSSRYAFLTVNLDGEITSWNPGAAQLFGYTEEDAIGRHISIIVPEDRRYEIEAIAEKIYRDEPILNLETVRTDKNGRRIDVILTASPVRDADGAVIGTSGIISDATEQKQAEQNFRLAVEACPSGMVVTDQETVIVLVNSELERIFGYRRDELIGQPIEILLPESEREKFNQMRENFADQQIKRDVSARQILSGQRKDGNAFPIEVGLNPIRSRDGLMVICAIADITERLQHERMKDEFVATVSHELRTPLTSIAGSLGLLIGNAAGRLPEPAVRLLTIAHKNSERLVRLINDVLDIEKLESGRVVFDLRHVEVRSLIEHTIDTMRGFAEDYGVNIRLNPDSASADVLADPDRLIQVVTNLLSNAIKYSPRDKDVVVHVENRDDRVIRITVRDYGPGIPNEFRAQIFGKFAQANTTNSRQKGGTGLGLSIAKQIVKRLDGEIGFHDAQGGGTIFYVDLPCANQEVRMSGDAHNVVEESPRLLICDDDPLVAQVLAERLDAAGFTSDIALSGREAIKSAVATHYTAILVDLRLPDCDGISLIQKLRVQPHNQNTPIIVVSVDPVSGRTDMRSANLNILDWFHKPVDIKRLSQVLKSTDVAEANKRPRILHIDPDAKVLDSVAHALKPTVDLVSVDSIDAARRALTVDAFDLVVLDMALASSSEGALFPELHDNEGDAIPIILFSAQDANSDDVPDEAKFAVSRVSVDKLIATLRKRLGGNVSFPTAEKEIA